MARTDKDSWDLASSVGATATMVAAARALAGREPEPLISDPFAEPLVRAVGIDFFNRLLDGEIEIADADEGSEFGLQRLIDMMAVRTWFFDDFFTAASAAGVRQAVILATGLDARAYRLQWPAGTVVYEVDQPAVLEFKSATLSKLGVQPTAECRSVPVDLREDWPAALRRSGFDQSKAAAWSAEGLLMYLPPEAQDQLFDDITAISAPGSRLATEYHPDGLPVLDSGAKAMAGRWRKFGFDVDLSMLVYPGQRSPVRDYLAARGWQVSTRTRAELFADVGRSLPENEATQRFRSTIAITAVLKK